MKLALLSLLACLSLASAAEDTASVIIVVGAGGAAEYDATFATWAERWVKACTEGGAASTVIGLGEDRAHSRERLRQALQDAPKEGQAELWIVLLGHGNADRGDAKFNLTGDDLSTSELADLLTPLKRPLVVINSFSASGAFLAPLAAPGRVILTSTKSASEHNYSRFGGYLSESIADPAADLDKDGQTSLLEAWLAASHRTAAFYQSEGRLATEHSMLDDNGDGKATPSDWFHGVRAVKKAKDGTPADGMRANQVYLVRNTAERMLTGAARSQRDGLEGELAQLREAKSSMPEDAYFRALETLLLKLARVYKRTE